MHAIINVSRVMMKMMMIKRGRRRNCGDNTKMWKKTHAVINVGSRWKMTMMDLVEGLMSMMILRMNNHKNNEENKGCSIF